MRFDFEAGEYQVIADVTECRDAYGTGDSPTLYDVDIVKVTTDDGLEVTVNDYFYNSLVDEAISIYKGE